MTEDEAFTLLGIKPGSSPGRVDAAYKERVWAAHPDRGGEAEAFSALGEARRIAKAAAEEWPCEACKGAGSKAISGRSFGAIPMICGACGGTGKKW